MSTETFWFSDPSVLFNQTNWYKFVPTATMSVPESLNAVVRFSSYLAVLLFLASMNPLYMLMVPAVMGATIVLFGIFPQASKIKESFSRGLVVSSYVGDSTTRPSDDNPFMNPSLADILDKPNAPPADDPTKKDVRDEINKAFAKTSNMYMDTTDVFEMVQAQRNFYTVMTDDHAGFLQFLGKNARTDKLLSEGYVAAKGTVPELPSAQTTAHPTGASYSAA